MTYVHGLPRSKSHRKNGQKSARVVGWMGIRRHYRNGEIRRTLPLGECSEVAPITDKISADLGSQTFRSSSRGPIVVEHQGVTSKRHSMLCHGKKRAGRHRPADAAAAGHLEHPDVNQSAAGAAATLGLKPDTTADPSERPAKIRHGKNRANRLLLEHCDH